MLSQMPWRLQQQAMHDDVIKWLWRHVSWLRKETKQDGTDDDGDHHETDDKKDLFLQQQDNYDTTTTCTVLRRCHRKLAFEGAQTFVGLVQFAILQE